MAQGPSYLECVCAVGEGGYGCVYLCVRVLYVYMCVERGGGLGDLCLCYKALSTDLQGKNDKGFCVFVI